MNRIRRYEIDLALPSQAEEERLRAWFATLPECAPRPGFVSRVMFALPRRSWLDSRWARTLLVAALAAVAIAAGLLLPVVGPVARWVGPAELLNLWIGSIAALATHLSSGLTTWNALASAGQSLAHAFSLPPLVGLLLFNALLAVAALRGLIAISSKKRSAPHVGSVALPS